MRASQWIELSAGLLATVLNLILIPIILTKSSVKMGPYKYFLLAYTITATVYSYGVCTSLFTWYLPKDGFLFISTITIFPRWLQGLHFASFCACYLNTIIILAGSFVYRFSILQNSVPWMVKRSFAPLTIIVLIIPQFFAIGGFLSIMPSDITDDAYRDEVREGLGLDISAVYYVGGQYIINAEPQLMTIWMLGITCIFFGTCLPLFFYTLPLTVVLIMSFSSISIDGFTHLCAMCLPFAQAIDPMLTIYFITDYKHFLLRKRATLCHYFGITSHTVHIFTAERSSTRNTRL